MWSHNAIKPYTNGFTAVPMNHMQEKLDITNKKM